VSFLRRTEFPTWLVATAIYTSWILLTLHANAVPLWALIPVGGYVVAWHGSLQHEVIHDHPTPWRWLNTAIALPPISLWLPFPIYRETHLQHHAVGELTDPDTDPESRYVVPHVWASAKPVRRALWWSQRTVLGRLAIGPAISALRFWRHEVVRFARGDRAHLLSWIVHVLLLAGVWLWLSAVCHLSVWRYVIGFGYPGLSLTLLRSFTEHRPAATQAHASAIVESGLVGALLFLNNNLHVVHHADPSLPWYQLTAKFRARRGEWLTRCGEFYYTGYLAIFRRYGVVPMGSPQHTPRAALVGRAHASANEARRA
jgi:fatty acid desaturase